MADFDVSDQNPDAFFKWFQHKRSTIHERLQSLQEGAKAKASGRQEEEEGGAEGERRRQRLTTDLDEQLSEVFQMEYAINVSAVFLSKYDRQSYQQAAQALRLSVAAARSTLVPRKRFAFTRREGKTPISGLEVIRQENAERERERERKGKEGGGASGGFSSSVGLGGRGRPSDGVPPVGHGNELLIAGRKGKMIKVKKGTMKGKDLGLRDLTDCVVIVPEAVGAVRAFRLQGCQIWLPAVGSSVLVYECSESAFHSASKQLRIHDCTRVAFFVRTLSSPVVERTRDAFFAPLDIQMEEREREEMWQSAGLPPLPATEDEKAQEEEESAGYWRRVLDFDWIKRTASPHWTVLLPSFRPPCTRLFRLSSKEEGEKERPALLQGCENDEEVGGHKQQGDPDSQRSHTDDVSQALPVHLALPRTEEDQERRPLTFQNTLALEKETIDAT
uniref:C-CAP/cofactor C-like domain-containing protein n=1 Tax=Chromera velia CCMP2878 TaxID=1169474 RepID=A0A0G4I5Q2_9ALVE|eukprot:Cvel_1871.t1-p1 / transcript=Cvel_1871.t1 / gene=Cvel_1871 / organism=Chromera_velia_CCMP2878 / gene_product=Tubulin-specific chaperone C, putative / transcript_product=Tubulin-specific chaperone C, putative / location=Cvel_scaffold69:125542-129690(+) / protein_length=445 / sequence_SO=supercontig / SO=protein_coding / is_pseudo=false